MVFRRESTLPTDELLDYGASAGALAAESREYVSDGDPAPARRIRTGDALNASEARLAHARVSAPLRINPASGDDGGAILAPERCYDGHQPRNCAMPKPLLPPRLPSERDEDPIWGDLFGFRRRPAPDPSPATDAATSVPAPRRKPPNKSKKPHGWHAPPAGTRNS